MTTIRSDLIHLEVDTSATATAAWVDACGREFNPSGSERGEIDITNWCDAAQQKDVGSINNGTLSITYNYDPENQAQAHLASLFKSGNIGKFRLVFNHVTPNKQIKFTARVSKHPGLPSLAQQEVAKIEVTLLITGTIGAYEDKA